MVVKTMPDDGEEVVLGWVSCIIYTATTVTGHSMIQHNPSATYAIGDTPYSEHSGSVGGISSAAASYDLSEQNMNDKYRGMYRNTGMKAIAQNAPHYRMHDDHEWPGDDWDHTITQANDDPAPDIAITQADVDAIYSTFRRSSDIYAIGNPSNTDPEAAPEYPKYAGLPTVDNATPESNYTPAYFRHRINDLVEVFVCDFVSHRSPINLTTAPDTGTYDAPDKVCLGATQLAWLKKYLYESTATYKVLMFPKRVYGDLAGGAKQDAWGVYKIERDSFVRFLNNSTRSAADRSAYGTKDITGVVACTGDKHIPIISYSDIVDVCACPSGVEQTLNNYKVPEEVARYVGNRRVYGLLRANSEFCSISLYDWTGNEVWSGRVYAGENKLTYPRTAVAFG